MFSKKVLESLSQAKVTRNKVWFPILPIMAIGGTAAAESKITPKQEQVLHEGTDPSKGRYDAIAKTDYEIHPPRPGREPTPKEIAEGRTDTSRVTPIIKDSQPWDPRSKSFDKDFWKHPIDETSTVLGTYVRKVSQDLLTQPLRPEHQFATALAGEDIEDRGPEDSLLKRVTHRVGEMLPFHHDTSKKDYTQEERGTYTKGTTTDLEKMTDIKDRTADKMSEMKEKAVDTVYNIKEKSKEVATDMKDKMSDYTTSAKEKAKEITPSKEEAKEKINETKEKAGEIGSTIKNKVSEYVPTSLSTIKDTVKSVVVGPESIEAKVPGDAERLKTRLGEEAANLLQSHNPINNFKTHTASIRVYADEPKRQLLAHKYTAHINEDVMQTLIMDSDRTDARLIGIEYCITDRIYRQLPEEEKKLWYSHAFETRSGIEVAPRLPNNIETELMQNMAPTYGKSISLWQVDQNLLPVGFPKLLAPPLNEQMINKSVWDQREKLFGPVSKERQLRLPIQTPVPQLTAESWEKKGAIFTPEFKKQ